MGAKTRFIIPIVVFAVLVVFLGIGLTLDPRKVPSPFIDKPAPDFSLPSLHDVNVNLSPQDLAGRVWLLNVWASWCVACRAEHEVLKDLAREDIAPIIGLNYKDHPDNAKRWLQQLGDPYQSSAVDANGKAGIDWGVYGVPETFVIDQQGIVRYKHIGPITAEELHTTIIPLVKTLRQERA